MPMLIIFVAIVGLAVGIVIFIAAKDLRAAVKDIREKKKEWEKQKQADVEAINILANEKSQGFPWLSQAYADYFYLQGLMEAAYLEYKPHPAPTSAEKVREIAKERKNIEEKLRHTQWIINYYHNLFPFLEDFLEDIDEETLKKILDRNIEKPLKDFNEIGEANLDPVRLWLSREEYQNLSDTERNQRALDNWKYRRHKRPWDAGKEYERFIGYKQERDGYRVEYTGILDGRDDMGRDLICKKGDQTIIIQCKRWKKLWKDGTPKEIHENHVCQLMGTIKKYQQEKPNEQVSGCLYTTTKLTERAKDFAKSLNIGFREEFLLEDYPLIKCNVSKRPGHEKIYHLPFDQQYDRTVIEEENECYAWTVKEAEDKGFRRAERWRGENQQELIYHIV